MHAMHYEQVEEDNFLSKASQWKKTKSSKFVLSACLVLVVITCLAYGTAKFGHVGNIVSFYKVPATTPTNSQLPSRAGYDFNIIQPPPPRNQIRTPVKSNSNPDGFTKYTYNLFDHPLVLQAARYSKYPQDVANLCFGPAPNVDIYIKEDKVSPDVYGDFGLNVFALDCRSLESGPQYRLLGFIAVMDMYGNLVNALSWNVWGGSEVECVNMFNTTTVLFTTQRAAYHWDYTTNALVMLPFASDTHSLVYRYTDDRYYGLFSDKYAIEYHNAQAAVAFDPYTGTNSIIDPNYPGWSFYYGESHFNYLSVDGDFAYASSRQLNSLIKINMRTNQIEWFLGGSGSSFTIYDINGNPYPSRVDKSDFVHLPWGHQHKFQTLGNNYFSLFDNNVGNDHKVRTMKPWGSSSRNVILYVDEETMQAWEIYSYIIGDDAMSYGCTEVLPSGNILTNSYVDWVYPTVEDQQYHVNIWEISRETNEPVWRIGFKGLNPVTPQDVSSPYPHYFSDPMNPDSAAPTGWNIYNVDRVYQTVSLINICVGNSNGKTVIQFAPFNTIKTQADAPGVVYVSQNGNIIGKGNFYFQRSWLARPEQVVVDANLHSYEGVSITVNNQWNNPRTVYLDDSVAKCT